MTNKQRLGTFFLAAGSLILFGVLLIWLVAPWLEPPSYTTTAAFETSSPLSSGPALSPFDPPSLSINEDNSILDLTEDESSSQNDPKEDRSLAPSSHNWNVISYAEAKALSINDKTIVDSSIRLAIPALNINAPVVPVTLEDMQYRNGRPFRQWSVPNKFAAGWHDSSAPPGQAGNTVLNGHNNIHGAIFGNLVDLTLGEQIILYEADRKHIYQVVHREFLPENGEPLRTRLRNARWIAPSNDTRLTIVTCWPNTSNSHRLVVIAQPQSTEPGF